MIRKRDEDTNKEMRQEKEKEEEKRIRNGEAKLYEEERTE